MNRLSRVEQMAGIFALVEGSSDRSVNRWAMSNPTRGTPMGKVEMEEREFWGSIAFLADSVVFFLGVDIALEALRREDRRDMDSFSQRYLGRRLPPHELTALFVILTRSNTWRKVGWPAITRYLGRATWIAGQGIRRDWEWGGIPRPEQRELEARAAVEFNRSRTRFLRPDRKLERNEARALRALIMERVHARIRKKGTERDRMILDALERGQSPAKAMSKLGLKTSAWEAYRRKLERWGRKEVRNLRSEMSTRRVSAT